MPSNTSHDTILEHNCIYLDLRAIKGAKLIDKSGSGISNMWRKFSPYARVTLYGACAVAANTLSMVAYYMADITIHK